MPRSCRARATHGEALPQRGQPDAAAQQERQQHGGAAHVLGALGQRAIRGRCGRWRPRSPLLSSSTISTSTTVPASSATSTQLRPTQKAAGSMHDGAGHLLPEGGLAPAGAKAVHEISAACQTRARPRRALLRVDAGSGVAHRRLIGLEAISRVPAQASCQNWRCGWKRASSAQTTTQPTISTADSPPASLNGAMAASGGRNQTQLSR